MQEGNPNESQLKQLAELEQMKKDYLNVFSTVAGKQVLENLENVCFIHKTTFTKDTNGLTIAFHEGMRFVVVHIKNMMTMNIETLKKLATKGE